MAQAISAQVVVAHARRQGFLYTFLLHFGKTWSWSHAAQRLDCSSGRVGADPPWSSSRESKMALRKGEPSATRAGFWTSRKRFGTPRPLEAAGGAKMQAMSGAT